MNAGKGPGGSAGTGDGSAGEEKPPSLLNILVKTTDGERGWFSHVAGFFDDYKTYGLGFLNRDVAGAALSWYGGFNIEKIAGTDAYKVSGRKKFDNKVLNNLYQRFKSYDVNGNARALGDHTKRIKETTFNAFQQSKQNMTTDMDLKTFVKNSVVSGINDGWNPFSKKGLNKAFFAKSNVMKMNGPLNYAMATAGSIWDYSPAGSKSDKGWASTDFAADVTTELAIGVGSTAIGSVASSIATGMAAGSVVPGLGTVAGAAAGLTVGLITTYLINGTERGRNLKKGLTKGIKWAYDGISKGVKSGFRKLGGLFG
ncbi:hypothetical protein CVD28_23980 [Bacillus sp. M6-12]|nr:hypothetical protein CVD28_23980 [Bacillus sp. M6-12]